MQLERPFITTQPNRRDISPLCSPGTFGCNKHIQRAPTQFRTLSTCSDRLRARTIAPDDLSKIRGDVEVRRFMFLHPLCTSVLTLPLGVHFDPVIPSTSQTPLSASALLKLPQPTSPDLVFDRPSLTLPSGRPRAAGIADLVGCPAVVPNSETGVRSRGRLEPGQLEEVSIAIPSFSP